MVGPSRPVVTSRRSFSAKMETVAKEDTGDLQDQIFLSPCSERRCFGFNGNRSVKTWLRQDL